MSSKEKSDNEQEQENEGSAKNESQKNEGEAQQSEESQDQIEDQKSQKSGQKKEQVEGEGGGEEDKNASQLQSPKQTEPAAQELTNQQKQLQQENAQQEGNEEKKNGGGEGQQQQKQQQGKGGDGDAEEKKIDDEDKEEDEEGASNSEDDYDYELEEQALTEEEIEQMKKEIQRKKEAGEELTEEEQKNEIPTTKIVKKKIKKKNKQQDQLQQTKQENERKILEFFQEKLEEDLDKFDIELWKDLYNEYILDFIYQPHKMTLFAWCIEDGVAWSDQLPMLDDKSFDQNFEYFIKVTTPEGKFEINFSSLDASLAVGTIKQAISKVSCFKALLLQMERNFIPNFQNDKNWPENVKKEFIGNIHKFMANLTEVVYQQEGFTKLYIPNEDLSNQIPGQPDKDLAHRLETTLQFWFNQIKDVINSQDNQNTIENPGPIEEIMYWTQRQRNLSQISEQLENPKLKNIKQFLKQMQAQYVEQFEQLSQKIIQRSTEAANNLDFLKSLSDPCKNLQETHPRDIPKLLPDLLNRVRMIWEHSKYYNTSDCITSLLHKISNEIIKRCKDTINIRDMLYDDVEKCKRDLQDSIDCGKEWRIIYDKTATIIAKNSKNNKVWDFNKNSIFAQVDAFVQRCSELKEICEGQLQFARKGNDAQIPQFGGSKGPEIVSILDEIQQSFKKNLDKISDQDQDKILNVKASRWHDDFNAFKNGMKDLDVMYQNIINSAFESVTTVQQGVEMVEAFDYLAKRDGIKTAVKRKAQQVLTMFLQELESTKAEFEKRIEYSNKNNLKILNVPIGHGKHSGFAIWVRSLIFRIEKMKQSFDKLSFIKEEDIKRQAAEKYESVLNYLRNYILNDRLKVWKQENQIFEESKTLSQKLDLVILEEVEKDTKSKYDILNKKKGHLISNFDLSLFKLLKEVPTWNKLQLFGVLIPNNANDISTLHKENLRVLREQVMLVVRDYNQIIDSIKDTKIQLFEKKLKVKKLFSEHLDATKKAISSGVSKKGKLKWSSQRILESFVTKSRASCEDLFTKLNQFKRDTLKIYDKCKDISQEMLIKIDKKKVYENKEFEEEQDRHQKILTARLRSILDEIKTILSNSYNIFFYQDEKIQTEWFKYVQLIDEKIEEALEKCVKTSLIELYKVIGEQKTQIQIFKLSVELEQGTLDFRPHTSYLEEMLEFITTQIIDIIRDFKRMEVLIKQERQKKIEEQQIQEKDLQGKPQKKQLIVNIQIIEDTETKEKEDNYWKKITENKEIQKQTKKILESMKKTCASLRDKLDPWKKQEWHWVKADMKERFARIMVDRTDSESIGNLKNQIESFGEKQNGVQANKTTDKQGCILIDNTSIKTTLVELFNEWQNQFLNAIMQKACQELSDLYQLFDDSKIKLSEHPDDLFTLKESQDLWQKLTQNKHSYEEQLDPLEEKFKLLDDYNQGIKDEFIFKRNNLKVAWQEFNQMLEKTKQRNDQVHNVLYADTQKQLGEFMRESGEVKQHFIDNAPFSAKSITNEKAFQILNEYREQVKQMRQREKEMRFGFDLFEINYQPSSELEYVEKEIQVMEQIWQHKEEWDKKWDEIKAISFMDAEIEELDIYAEDFQRVLIQYPPNILKWDILQFLQSDIENFRNTLPLLQELRQPYMRQRHWIELKKTLGTFINPQEPNFNLDQAFEHNLIQHTELVRDQCSVASKEYQIEKSIKDIEDKWKILQLDMVPHKESWKIKSTDEIYTSLEDNMAVLSSQKTTIYYDNFKDQIISWETKLSRVSETLEMILQVQKQWIYLQQIFESQGTDSDKQLIGDITKFRENCIKLRSHMARLWDNKNALTALCPEGINFIQQLQDISKKFDEIQKVLNQLLDVKRKEFPRFYFLSNDDLFELLGDSKNPQKINKHIKKCFEGINKLMFSSIKSAKNDEVQGMQSPDGEQVKFIQSVNCEASVELWLRKVEQAMKDSLKKNLQNCCTGRKKEKDTKWVSIWLTNNIGQLLLTTQQIFWTDDCHTVLQSLSTKENAEKNLKKSWKSQIDDRTRIISEFSKLIRKPKDNTERLKIVALITIEVHAKDIIEQLIKLGCISTGSFDWQKQLRFKKIPQGETCDCIIEQTTGTRFPYGFEYQGNNGRLVVTGLTDRCYLTLTTAMHLKRGGAPQGPAGTGKTETVKDLGKNMAKFVLVFNCSEGLDQKSIGKMFSGLIQTGGWGCFDEFNRIEIEVLSVVAQQIHQILNALTKYDKDNFTFFNFEDNSTPINPETAIFITMNPGYAGRTELPDNLKSLFRPISMITPNYEVICEIMLQSEGFRYVHPINSEEKPLNQKIVTLYKLMQQQLSKQKHYDFGLRAIKSVLTCAGAIKRKGKTFTSKQDKETVASAEATEQIQEQQIVMKAIMDMNMPKFIAEDIPLFNALFTDIFSDIEMPDDQNQAMSSKIETVIRNAGLVVHPQQITKVIQLYDSKNTRHGNMLVGSTLSGKSTIWKILERTLNGLNKDSIRENKEAGKESQIPSFPAVKVETLNPKSISIDELFGSVDQVNQEWTDGVLSSMMSRLCKEESNDERWIIFDGPVDTLWIESMNTLLDDNKILTLLNNDRIAMPPQVGLLFEVENLDAASPATVSRVGMIYVDINDFGWEPYAEAWIERIKDEQLKELMYDMFMRWVPKMLSVKKQPACKEIVQVSESEAVITLCKLLDAFQQQEQTISFENQNKNEIYVNILEKWFTFCVAWSIGASLDEVGRKLFDYAMRDIESMFPHAGMIFDYCINNEKNEWQAWEDSSQVGWKSIPKDCAFHQIFVPTTDTKRNKYIIRTLSKYKINVLVTGITGTGKSALMNEILQDLDETAYISQTIVFSSQTSSQKIQEIIESRLIKRSKDKMIPDGKKAVIFIDDLNMPKKDDFGSQPPLELIRQWMDYNGWFDRKQRSLFKQILEIQFLAAQGPAGGGRANISKRIQSKFSILNFTFPQDVQVKKILQTILVNKFQLFEEDIKILIEPIATATLTLFQNIQENFLPTPQKSHYVFNMRDMLKVIQGLYLIDQHYCDSKFTILKAWVHECLRVYNDRLICNKDRDLMKKLISDRLEQDINTTYKECTNEQMQDPLFVDFMGETSMIIKVYEEVPYENRGLLRDKCNDFLKQFNEKNKAASMNIVLFQDAVNYLCQIHRILRMQKGHGMLVGEGGSGRHSLTKLAAFIANYQIWQIQLNKNYRAKEFREDIKRWAKQAGQKDVQGVLLFSDNQFVNESFAEDLNNILSVGEVPGLFTIKDDLPEMKDNLKRNYQQVKNLGKDAKISDEDLMKFFTTRMQSNFHLMILMNQTNNNLRNYCRQYPGFLNNTTMIWFMPWPTEGLIEIANKYLESEKIVEFDQELIGKIATFFGEVHSAVMVLSDKMFQKLKRKYYVTPTNYIELVNGYIDLLKQKQSEIGKEIDKLSSGLLKIEQATQNNIDLNNQLTINQNELSKKTKDVEDCLVRIQSEKANAEEFQKDVEKRKLELNIKKEEIEQLKTQAQADVERVEPALKEAEVNLEKLTNQELAQVKSYANPPAKVLKVMQVVMTILGKDTSWASAKKELADPNFLRRLKEFDKDNMNERLIKKIEKFTHRSDMGDIKTVSEAAFCLWNWVQAMENYGKAFAELKPKKIRVNTLSEKLQKSMEELTLLEQKLIETQEKIGQQVKDLENYKLDKEKYAEETNNLQQKLERADKLLSGLASTKEGWEKRKKGEQSKYNFLIGDSLISAAFMSYSGPFPSEYRDDFVNDVLMKQIKHLKIIYNPKKYQFYHFLSQPQELLKWTQQKLPDDDFSKDNAVLVTKNRKWPLMIDPQLQANTWIKQMEKERDEKSVIIIDPFMDNYMNIIEKSLAQGNIVIFQNLDEKLDPALDPILNKQIKLEPNGKYSLYMGEKAVLYNPNFRLYMFTKLMNPLYEAEVTTKVTLVNFQVKEKGLQSQLLSEVIKVEKDDLEKQKIQLIEKEAKNQNKLKELDDTILQKLSETQGQLVDNLELIKSLGEFKEIEDNARKEIEISNQAIIKTNKNREIYRPLADLGTQLFFIINEFSSLDNMYQFSLETYIQNVFKGCLEKTNTVGSTSSDSVQERIKTVSKELKQEVYKYASRGLFEKDKLLLSIQMAVKLSKVKTKAQKEKESKEQTAAGGSGPAQPGGPPDEEVKDDSIDKEEFEFFLRGGVVVDRKGQTPNPNKDWISDLAWDMICELEKMRQFQGIQGSFNHNQKEWKKWYMDPQPEISPLPGDWEGRCDKLRKMILIKGIRPDRVRFAAINFVKEKLDEKFVKVETVQLDKLLDDTKIATKTTPIIFILAPGVDPFPQLVQLASSKDKILHPVSLGQGQALKAKNKIIEGTSKGYWLYLANCHLSIQFLKELEKILEELEARSHEINENFRLFITTNPHPRFPVSILQKGIRITTEPPKGLKSNMLRLYQNMPQEKFDNIEGDKKIIYERMLFSLCWFHSLLIERKRFKTLGWNVNYDFNDSDFETSDRIMTWFIDSQQFSEQGIQWPAINTLIADIIYGGRVTDDWDRKLLFVYSKEYFNQKIITEEKHKLGDPNENYLIQDEVSIKDQIKIDPKQLSLPQMFSAYIEQTFPAIEKPEVFGQFINAEIQSRIQDTDQLLDSILALQPRQEEEGKESTDDKVAKIIKELLEDMLPQEIDLEEVKLKNKLDESNPLRVVLFQEINRYNKLLEIVRTQLQQLQACIKGEMVISTELEQLMHNLDLYRVPPSWKLFYHSLKPLYSWMKDLILRIQQFYQWAFDSSPPNVYWISGFSFPTGFTTALLQQHARRLGMSVDSFSWEFYFLPQDTNPQAPAKEGAYIRGLFLEGAKWDSEKNYLMESEAMKLNYEMPIIHFKPHFAEVKVKQKKAQNQYACPVYMYPIRDGVAENPSYQMTINLPIKPNPHGAIDTDTWVKRGTALLMQLAN